MSGNWRRAHDPAIRNLGIEFGYSLVPDGPLKAVAASFTWIADEMLSQVPSSPELQQALETLLEARGECLRLFNVDMDQLYEASRDRD